MSVSQKKNRHGGRRDGAGRKPKYENSVMIAAAIPAKLRDQLDHFAEANELSRSEAIVEAIRRLHVRRG